MLLELLGWLRVSLARGLNGLPGRSIKHQSRHTRRVQHRIALDEIARELDELETPVEVISNSHSRCCYYRIGLLQCRSGPGWQWVRRDEPLRLSAWRPGSTRA